MLLNLLLNLPSLNIFLVHIPVFSIHRYSSYTLLKCIIAWILRFIFNCCPEGMVFLGVTRHCLSRSYGLYFVIVITSPLRSMLSLVARTYLLPYHPFLDSSSVLRVGSREQNSNAVYSSLHPIILHGKHPLAKLIVHSEHIHLLMQDLDYSLLYSFAGFTLLDTGR